MGDTAIAERCFERVPGPSESRFPAPRGRAPREWRCRSKRSREGHTVTDAPSPALLTPLTLRVVELRNRAVISPMQEYAAMASTVRHYRVV